MIVSNFFKIAAALVNLVLQESRNTTNRCENLA